MDGLSPEFWPLVLVGFLAQLIDGALGMAYGVSASAFLATMGHPPAFVSATVHAAEVVTTGASGLSHAWFRNLDRKIFFRLVLPGMVGGALGAYLLTSLDGSVLRPFVWGWLLLTGILLLRRAFRRDEPGLARAPSHALGGIAGFLDAIGGGGWGPIVTSTLLARGNHTRYTIGTVNAVEFFVTLTSSAVFPAALGVQHWNIVLGLALGGLCAAPVGGYLAKRVPHRPMMAAVGLLIVGTSGFTLWKTLLA